MATLPETAKWEDGIYQLEATDPVQGGQDGIDNLQGKQLANRTAYLKQQVDTANTGLANHIAAADPHPQYTTAAELEARIAALVASSPAALDTLNELAAALGNDPNFATTVTNALATKAPLASPALTGTPTAPTAAAGTNNTQLATTAMVHSAITNDLHVTGSAPMYACRTWVNFDGTASSPTPRASGNISSLTKNGTGNYTINFATAMPDANYNIVWGNDTDDSTISNFSYSSTAASRQLGFISSEKTTSLCKIYSGYNNPSSNSSGRLDFKEINVAIFR
jgi:hypothetical protein